jgi:hypothetical protein
MKSCGVGVTSRPSLGVNTDQHHSFLFSQQCPQQALSFVKEHCSRIDAILEEYCAVLFLGFPMEAPKDLFVEALDG